MNQRANDLIRRIDDLVHHPRLGWVPPLLTGWVCDLYDRGLGLSWTEIRRNRHGKLLNYWRRYSPGGIVTSSEAANTTLGAKITYKQVDR